jgi:hypothetical protein
MNPRALTPAIVLVSFGAAFVLTGWHAGLWHAAAPDEGTTVAGVPLPTPLTAAATPAPAAAAPEHGVAAARAVASPPPVSPQPGVNQDASAAPEDGAPAVVTPQAQAAASEGFLDARERAAEHGARSH